MELKDEEKQALEVLAEEFESSPEVRLRGIPKRILGARIGAYFNNPIYIVAKLRDKGLVSILDDRVVLTRKGYTCIKPPYRRIVQFYKNNTLISLVSIIVTLTGIVLAIILLIK